MGTGTALCAFLIGRHIFNASVGILACGITAFYPYYVMHDTALQETGMITFCTALSVWLLLRASTLNRNRDWFLAGLVLGAITFVRDFGGDCRRSGAGLVCYLGARGQCLGKAAEQFDASAGGCSNRRAMAHPNLSSYGSACAQLANGTGALDGKQL